MSYFKFWVRSGRDVINEIVGWGEEGKIDLKRFYPIFIRDHRDGEKIKKRIELVLTITMRDT